MKVGAWFDLRNPPGWQLPWADHYAFTLEMCEEAERVGLSSVWFSEHHGFEDGYLPQPLTFAAAARTRTIRIGTSIVIAPLRAPAQLAEEAALVDILSGGRLDLGLGAGYRIPEYALFDADMPSRFRTLDARVGEIRALWASGKVTPAPVQADLPIWMGYHAAKGAHRTGRNGERLLTVDPAIWSAYREGLEAGGHPLSRGIMSGAISGHVTDDPERDWPLIAPRLAYQWDSYYRYGVEGTDRPPPPPTDPEKLRANGLTHPTGKGFLVAGPEEWARQLRTYLDGVPVDTVFFVASTAGLPREATVRHIAALGRLQALLAP